MILVIYICNIIISNNNINNKGPFRTIKEKFSFITKTHRKRNDEIKSINN